MTEEITAVLCVEGKPSEVASILRHHAARIEAGDRYDEASPRVMVRGTGSSDEEPMPPCRMHGVFGDGGGSPWALFDDEEGARDYIATRRGNDDPCVVRADVVGLLWNSTDPDPR